MAINRNPKKNFTQIPNEVFETVPLNMVGIVNYFLSKKTGWKMKINDLLEHWTASKQSLRNGLRELRKMDIIKLEKVYDTKKKRFAGSYYILKEPGDGSKTDMDGIKTAAAIFPEQTPPKSRVSAKAECLQNKGVISNTDITNSNTNNKFIESNTIREDDEISEEDEDEGLNRPCRTSRSIWDQDRDNLYNGLLKKRLNRT